MSAPYRTIPADTEKMPPGIPYIVGNEAAERFNFYGLKAILVIYMTKFLMDRSGELAPMSKEEATGWYHLFVGSNYFFPAMGAILADAFLGKYRTILWLSILYSVGCIALAVDHTRFGLGVGLVLIALGAGGIKPCVSSNVGDQFGPKNQHLLSKAFGWFYWAVNFGAFFSIMLTPWLLDTHGPGLAFGVPAGLMLLATFIFWSGRRSFVHVPPAGLGYFGTLFSKGAILLFLRFNALLSFSVFAGYYLVEYATPLRPEDHKLLVTMIGAVIYFGVSKVVPRPTLTTECRETWMTLGRLAFVFAFMAVFWALWDQCGSTWTLQAENMNRVVFGMEIRSSQVQAVNSILTLTFIPLFGYVVYPLMDRAWKLTPLRKIGIGIFTIGLSFLVSAWIESQLNSGVKLSVLWQLPAYVLLTAGEVMASITALEFAYTQAPKHLKAVVQAVYLLSVTAGNWFTAGVQWFISNPDGTAKLSGASYFVFFAALAMVAALVFSLVARNYRQQDNLQTAAA